MSTTPTFASVFAELASPAGLAEPTARATFDAILRGDWTAVQIGAFISALRIRGETPGVIREAATAMRAAMMPVEHAFDQVLDTCGTGGDGLGTVNLSTATAIVARASGIAVAKHGNRAVSSRAGSADVVEALGIPLAPSAEATGQVFREARIAFMLAPTHHPAMRHAMPARRELSIRTIFNCLGPLCNPARATHQVVGAFAEELLPVMAQTLGELGVARAWVVRGEEGLDEVSPYGPTRVYETHQGKLSSFVIAPADFGLNPSPPGAARGGDAAENAAILEAVLAGESHPARDAVILNSAAALVVALDLSPKLAADRARDLIDSGAAQEVLGAWRRTAQAVAQEAAAREAVGKATGAPR